MPNGSHDPANWQWKSEPMKLCDRLRAPERQGVYELGYLRSHNHHVRQNARRLWYRAMALASAEEAVFVEAVHIAAFDYPWNKRNEWKGHWALEDC